MFSFNFFDTYIDSKLNEVLFELVDWDLKKVYARYDKFIIGNENVGYQIKAMGKFDGDAGDSFSQHVNMKFTTTDRDQDTDDGNCAVRLSKFFTPEV